ncbi:MAG: trypsin-like peptidase domain-containing protein [Myxococcales bacterium]
MMHLLSQLNEELVDLMKHVAPRCTAVSGLSMALGTSSGSGFLYDARGHVVTNFHVVEGLEAVRVHRYNEVPERARIVGVDPMTDLAVLHLDNPPADHLTMRAEAARPGELCFAFGSPLGVYPDSVTMGIVSAVNRSIARRERRPLEGVIQTDAAINPGNSGGPLVDTLGRVLGVNTCGAAGAEAIGFAVPAATVSYVIDELIAHGAVERAALGVVVAEQVVRIDGQMCRRLTVSDSGRNAALCTGDVLLAIDGRSIRNHGDLFVALNRDRIGRAISLNILRGGQPMIVETVPTRYRG